MRPGQWVWVWIWLLRLGPLESAPNLESAKALGRGAESPLFLDRPDFFDYPDSDQARLLAVAQFIGEKPVIFANSGAVRKGPKKPEESPGFCPGHPCLLSSPADVIRVLASFSLTAQLGGTCPVPQSTCYGAVCPQTLDPSPTPKNWVTGPWWRSR
ncbi:fertilization-influencing membrane protein isoform X1 [Bos taurus]|uniref:fertilization-influencing membrane protein isoform X1 n=1 Tax=Bos taurus TaxID=9913 RepID=UPI0028CB6B03|nr:fertilization-influencing membrane protein isoform X1 [Bos taurus]